MSDFVVSVIPTDPRWQPSPEAADACADLLRALLYPEEPDPEVEIDWYDRVAIVHPHENLQHVTCPRCGREISDWFDELAEEAEEREGLTALEATVPCCGARIPLTDLRYDWPCGFARFEIAAWNPERQPLSGADLAALGEALGHPVRQIEAHI
ncbi:hypothetical protein [Actinomadura kijaniata]|uniref:hypothetical protein n=1 Tax=Actinomadura kijaniata TaxID=46161 RepID=UPI00082B89F9|nr:hypothetical protein [Actinomadura kijaniata]